MIEFFSIMGGVLLIFGAYYTYVGNIFKSILIYLIADLCWLVLAICNKAWLGSLFILIGLIFAVLVFFKMNAGIFYKTISKDRIS